VCTGSSLNTYYTGRIPLILAWLSTFIFQAVVRSWWFGTPLVAALLPMTGVAFLLFTFYMATDPATTPNKRSRQILFGATVAAAYGLLQVVHVVFGLFFALVLVCGARGVSLWIWAAVRHIEAPVSVDQKRELMVGGAERNGVVHEPMLSARQGTNSREEMSNEIAGHQGFAS
jgi:hypothetical protein